MNLIDPTGGFEVNDIKKSYKKQTTMKLSQKQTTVFESSDDEEIKKKMSEVFF